MMGKGREPIGDNRARKMYEYLLYNSQNTIDREILYSTHNRLANNGGASVL